MMFEQVYNYPQEVRADAPRLHGTSPAMLFLKPRDHSAPVSQHRRPKGLGWSVTNPEQRWGCRKEKSSSNCSGQSRGGQSEGEVEDFRNGRKEERGRLDPAGLRAAAAPVMEQ